ncbi:transcription antitermination factor NusB [bacterium]|nr:transcription antitermination factor NusB [bacterium]
MSKSQEAELKKSSGSRRQAREAALQILYRMDGQSSEDLQTLVSNPRQLSAELSTHFAHFLVPEGQREFAAELAAGALRDRQKIDGIIEGSQTQWKLGRMAAIDRNLLRLSVYELITYTDIPPSVTINEAIELAKQFSAADSPSFINGILDQVAREKRLPSASS